MPEETSIGEQYRNHSPLESSDAGAQNATPVEAIPLNVARSMAFEREPVDIQTIRAIHAQTEPPALLKQHLAPSATPN